VPVKVSLETIANILNRLKVNVQLEGWASSGWRAAATQVLSNFCPLTIERPTERCALINRVLYVQPRATFHEQPNNIKMFSR
jgi:hypothetical protein